MEIERGRETETETEHEIKMLTFGIIWMMGVWESFVPFLQTFFKSEIIKNKMFKNWSQLNMTKC